MPSPIAHLTAGYIVYRIARGYAAPPDAAMAGAETGQVTPNARDLLLTSAAFSLLPDVDSLAGLLLGNFGRYHNNVTHSLLVGAGLALGFGGVMSWRRHGFWLWFLAAAGCYSTHVLMDAATMGRGVMALWPLSSRRYALPLTLFYGLHWSEGWLSVRHLWTVATELVFTALTMLFSLVWSARSRE